MELAIEVAYGGWGRVSPNPLVGSVILDQQERLIAYGFHQAVGRAHAEREALQSVSDAKDLVGATLYVTLEPCAHEGRTPSCAKALARLPLAKVVYGVCDPNPLVSGQGVAILQQAGLQVEQMASITPACEELAEVFLWNIREKKPFVALKMASSLDGKCIHASGQSQWITQETSRQTAGWLRAGFDAVVVGAETILRDNPRLNIRHPGLEDLKKGLIVFDRRGRVESEWSDLMVSRYYEKDRVIFVRKGEDFQFLDEAFSRGIRSLYVEGGPQVWSLFMASGFVQRVYQFVAPIYMGGASRSLSEGLTTDTLDSCPRLIGTRYFDLNDEILITGRWPSG